MSEATTPDHLTAVIPRSDLSATGLRGRERFYQVFGPREFISALARRWNAHDALVKACKAGKQLTAHIHKGDRAVDMAEVLCHWQMFDAALALGKGDRP